MTIALYMTTKNYFNFKNEEAVDEFCSQNGLFWEQTEDVEFPSIFFKYDNILLSEKDAKLYYPQVYEDSMGESPFTISTPNWDGKKPEIQDIRVSADTSMYGGIAKDIKADILINGGIYTLSVGTEKKEEILKKGKEDFINQVLIKPEILPSVFAHLEKGDINFSVDFYGEFNIKTSLNHEEVYYKGTDLNFCVRRFILENWDDELYGFFRFEETEETISSSLEDENPQIYVGTAFSTRMLNEDCTIQYSQISEQEFTEKKCDAYSIVGHEDTANILGVKFNRESITLKEGDILYIAELEGGRLPEGATTLPEGFAFQYSKVEVIT